MAADRGPLEPADPVTVALDWLRALLTEVHGQMASGADPQAVLWTIWTGGGHPHGWPQRLRSAALQGSRSAATTSMP